MYISPGLVQIADPGARGIGDGRGLGHSNSEDPAGGASRPRAYSDQHPNGSGAHQVERSGIAGAASDDYRHLTIGDVLLEVEWLFPARHMLGRDHGSLDHQDLETGLQRIWSPGPNPLWGEAARSDHTRRLDLRHPLPDEVRIDRFEVDLLHAQGCLLLGELCDLVEIGLGILVTSPEPFEVEDGEPPQLADRHRGGRADGTVHGRAHHRKRELEGVELPGDIHVVWIAGPSRRDDRDVVETVCLTT